MPGLAWLCPPPDRRAGARRSGGGAAGLHRRPALQRIRGSNGLGSVVGGRSLWGLTRHGARLQSGMNADRIVIE